MFVSTVSKSEFRTIVEVGSVDTTDETLKVYASGAAGSDYSTDWHRIQWFAGIGGAFLPEGCDTSEATDCRITIDHSVRPGSGEAY